MPSSISKKLLAWYNENKRDLPWRDHPDPYWVWVSEIMAQQTRLETAIPYFERWMERFPTVKALAEASQQEVLNLWEGLGYYSRARNLHKAAQVVVEEFGGELPHEPKALRSLPGIGRYTAGAIASLAFDMDEPVVDGNIKRVLARVFNVQEAVDTSAGEKLIWGLAEEHLPPGQAGDYNQALMDLGAMVCLPRNPNCDTCPLGADCQANRLSMQGKLPHKKPKAEVPHKIVTAAVMRRDGQVLIAQRPAGGLLGGMWEFPGGTQEDGESLPACLKREIKEELGVGIEVGEKVGVFKHTYTHFKVTLHAYVCQMNGGKPALNVHDDLRWVKVAELDDYPMGKIDRQISQQLAGAKENGS